MGTRSFSIRLGVEAIRGGCAQTYQQIACFYVSYVDDAGVEKAAVQDG